MRKYIHIGYPKNFSTSLQRDYFSKHPELFHLGIGLNDNLGYYDSIIEKAFEVYLKTCKELKYEEVRNEIKDHFSMLFDKAKMANYKAVGVSSEHISFSFTHDGLSAVEKANRIHSLFGDNTTIILIVRNQFDILKSIFRESVRVGFIGNFNKYIELLYKYQDRNFIYDFRYDLIYELYSNLFGSKNVKLMFFENYRDESGELKSTNKKVQLIKDLNTALDISNVELSFNHFNKAIPSDKILVKSKLNLESRHDLGNHLLESAEKHRIQKYLEEDLNFYEREEETYSDVLKKRLNTLKALESNEHIDLNYKVDSEIEKSLKKFYEKGNEKLSKLVDHSLPSQYFHLKF